MSVGFMNAEEQYFCEGFLEELLFLEQSGDDDFDYDQMLLDDVSLIEQQCIALINEFPKQVNAAINDLEEQDLDAFRALGQIVCLIRNHEDRVELPADSRVFTLLSPDLFAAAKAQGPIRLARNDEGLIAIVK